MLKTKPFDIVDHLETEKDIEEYLNAVTEEKDWAFLPVALADIARARKGMTDAAKAAGVSRTTLYHSLSIGGHPAFETVAKVADSLGYQITLVPKSARKQPQEG
ncbi:MAG: putative addiction module antidote protein [Spirochaetaceae bacterium]|jgi:probable addiction module antidote protein|nr:putative addiction module antidote protein [Spirochaetaceae bacterium]